MNVWFYQFISFLVQRRPGYLLPFFLSASVWSLCLCSLVIWSNDQPWSGRSLEKQGNCRFFCRLLIRLTTFLFLLSGNGSTECFECYIFIQVSHHYRYMRLDKVDKRCLIATFTAFLIIKVRRYFTYCFHIIANFCFLFWKWLLFVVGISCKLCVDLLQTVRDSFEKDARGRTCTFLLHWQWLWGKVLIFFQSHYLKSVVCII